MSTRSRHLSTAIARPVADVYAFVADPTNLPRWAPGLGASVVHDGDDWYVETPQGRARVRFAPPNPFGVLDHEVLTPSGEVVHVPLRAIADGEGCEVVFTLRPAPGTTDAALDRDEALVSADLARLRQILEGAAPAGDAPR